VTFGCFNNLLKLSDAFLAAASRVLGRVPRSRLVLKARLLSHAELAASLRERLEKAGVDPARVEVRGWQQGAGPLADYRGIDIALDSFPYNGATTTCEALWMGVPVVTLEGDRHAGRMGSSILHAAGLPELVTTSVDAYVEKCAELAASDRLSTLRGTLRDRMRASPLTDGKGMAAAFERCYREILEATVTSR
jgi:predicted O-linked N-acetylglucosamine transferase (SPINDLY family)